MTSATPRPDVQPRAGLVVVDDFRYLFAEPDPVPLPRGPRVSNDSQIRHRAKILSAVIHETAESGFVETSVANIARRARVSRRTFYENFDDKESAFLTAVSHAVTVLESNIDSALSTATTWPDRLLCGMRAYVEVLTRNTTLTRAFVLELSRSGASGYALERRHHAWWAGLLRREVAAARAADPELAAVTRDLDEDLSGAVVLGINGLVRGWLEHGDDERLLHATLILFTSVLTENAYSAVDLLKSGASRERLSRFLQA